MLDLSYATAAAVSVAGLLEGSGFPWPGALVIAGAAVSMGESLTAMPVVAGLFALSYCLGACLQYMVGRILGPLALSWLPEVHRTRLETLTTKHGSAAVLWTRPLAIGNYVSIPAGIMRMPLPRFALYTLLGIGPWALGMAVVGWLFGDQVEAANSAIGQWIVPAAALLGVALALMGPAKLALQRRTRVREAARAA